MRKGQNPAKFVNTVAKPAPITVAVLTYLPYLSGFYAEGLAVLKACLNSVHKETNLTYDLMVFDNGSCGEVQDFLLGEQRAGNIQFLILSEQNLGKGGAWNVIFDAAPGEFIAYADSDVLFHDNWLSKSKLILDTYPNVGMVTARPFITKKEFITATLDWANQNPEVKLERGKFVPWEVFAEFNLSLGQNLDDIKRDYEENDIDRLKFRQVPAFAGASHWQFLTRKEVITRFLPFDMDKPMGQVRQLDQRMNESGYLRLMTADVLADNMSNSLEKMTVQAATEKQQPEKKFRILDIPIIKRFLLFLHHRIFIAYYDR
jgi:glycosyltransferase involved in cell wall biosynthesis